MSLVRRLWDQLLLWGLGIIIQACSAEHRNKALYLGCFTFILSRRITQDWDLTVKLRRTYIFVSSNSQPITVKKRKFQ